MDPHPEKGQLDIFAEDNSDHYRLNKAMDLINQRFGEFTVAPAMLLNRSEMPNVIAPAWKPYGHRQSIPDSKTKKNPATIIKRIGKLDE